MDHRKEILRGAREAVERDQAKLDWYKKHGYYTPEDAAMFIRGIEHNKARIERLQNCSDDELTAELSGR